MPTTTYAVLIRALREEKRLSQEQMAEKIGISRSSWLSLEKGTKELSLSEASALAHFFGLTVDELMNGSMPNYEKYRQMILAYLRKAEETGVELKKTKLAKLLYFADFAQYYKRAESMSGMSYRRIEYGPVPDAYFRVLEEMANEAQIDVAQQDSDDGKNMYVITETRISKRKDIDKLSTDEQELIAHIWEKWKHANTKEIVQYTHEQVPFKSTVYGQIIPYDLIKEEKAEYIY